MEWKKILHKVGDFLTTIVLIFLAFIVGMVAVSKVSGQQPNVFGYELKTVLSGSMEPLIQTGSVIVVRQTDGTDHFQEGDIVTFVTEEKLLVTHRIIEVEGAEYITKGDNNNGPDMHPVHERNIVGQYAGITIPYVGYAMNFTDSKLGSTLVLTIPGILLLGYALKTIIGSFRMNKRKTTMDSEN